ncbi:MAG: ABC transporter permease [Bacteroidia bacterium]|nr:ABC transporter permease [Bacteroidia bacterium]
MFAINSVVVNKLRTFLSLFGITIGIFSIISVFTVIDWMGKSVRDSISTLGENVIYVQKWPWSFDPNMAWWDIIKWPAISANDYEAVIDNATKAEAACFYVYQPQNLKYRKNQANEAAVLAVTHEFENLRSFEIEKGRYFSPEESSSGKNVAIVGYEVASRLFEKADPIGKQIIIGGHKTNVIGVFKKEGKGGISDSGMDEGTVVPYNYGRNFINMRSRFLNSIVMIKAKNKVPVQELIDDITMVLRAARRLKPEETSNFSINKASMITQGFESVFRIINIVGWLIGGFSILVGGFGIANIMFVSVRERTNIIGIQKALGAKRSFILFQFLIESVLLSIIGGLVGVFLIFIATLFINYIYELNMYLTFTNVILAVVISGLIGIIAGYAPAYSAAKMNPVDAIGYSFT